MRWEGRRESDNVEDQRGSSGGFSGMPSGGRRVAVGGFGTIVIVIIALVMGADPTQLLQQVGGGAGAPQMPQQTQQRSSNPEHDELARFIKVVVADNEEIWNALMQQSGREYRNPRLVIFSDVVRTGCGNASSQTGPFYCPADEKIYIDLSFYDDMKSKYGKGGDFALAYVIAHEVGHHVQHVLGISDRVHELQQRMSKSQANQLSVKLELQADFLAGVWAHHDQKTKNILEEGDIEEALNTAQAIGDDHLQMQAQGYVQPESFTHGTSKERMYWFRKGFESGDLRQGDTFNGSL